MSIFRDYTEEELLELNSNYIISSWSHSKVSAFARNQKAFEMTYIYGFRTLVSSTTVAGQAYHYALQMYFQNKRDKTPISLPEMEILAYNYIDEFPQSSWKIQSTTPTIEACIQKAEKIVTALLKNFESEKSQYEDHIAQILFVEVKGKEFLTFNGVDIPLICNFVVDLVFEDHDGKIIVCDHKSKDRYSADDEVALGIGNQAIIYIKGIEAKFGLVVDEVWFAENKYSQNKDKSDQIRIHKVALTDDTRKLYEARLYEPLRAMIQAVSDPDYVYILNPSDNFVSRAELDDFWARTMICEVEEFNVEEAKKDLVAKRLKKIKDSSSEMITPKVIRDFQRNAAQFVQYDLSTTNLTMKEKIEHILRTFGIKVNVAYELDGFSSNTYLLEFSAGVKVTSIYKHKLDIANTLNVSTVRILNNLMVYEGKSYVAIEVSKQRDKDLIWDASELVDMKIPIGKDNLGNTLYWDLRNESTANKFTSGSVGSGKSASIISDLEYVQLMEEVKKIVIFDPKYEFTKYKSNPKITIYNETLEIEEGLKELVDEMDEKIKTGIKEYVFVIIDEYADILSTSRKGKELDIYDMVQDGFYAPKKMMGIPMPPEPKMKRAKVGELASFESNFMRLSQKGRSSGFRIDAATQRASAKIVTGEIKINYPVTVCFRVPKEIDSRIVLDESGAELLGGMGDGLLKSPTYQEPVRFQAFYKP